MKFYNLGGKTFETDFSKLLKCYESPEDETRFMDAVNQTRLVKISIAMKKLLLWQQTLTCLILLIDFLYLFNLLNLYLLWHQSYLSFSLFTRSQRTPELFQFFSFYSFSNGNLNKGH